jgi:D-alanyl-lipoteichoic acid acyltransferase DltB (MBOAT superfamily)
MFGIDLLRNFNYPYFSEILLNSGANGIFRRPGFGLCTFLWEEAVEDWHENKKYVYHFFGKWFWHGANWTFIAWGFINALYFCRYFE